MRRKLLFSLPRLTVPVSVKASPAPLGGSPAESTSSSSPPTPPTWTRSELEYPVRRVYCVGRNYREHALEMGGDPDREAPFFFQKPADAVVVCDPLGSSAATRVPYPSATSSLHHEGELVVAIGEDGSDIPVERAGDHVYGYAVGCDLTRRDLQSVAKRSGRPWDAAKGFDASCPMSLIAPREEVELAADTEIRLEVNGDVRQCSTLGQMIYSIPEIIADLSKLFRLCRGDLILTGTPAGVSELNVGDKVSIKCGELIPCEFVMGEPE